MIITASQQAIIIRRFVQFVEDNTGSNSLDLSQLLQAEQDYKLNEVQDTDLPR